MARGERQHGPVDFVITGGGTAGHVLPALAVASALVEAGHDQSRVRFIGSRRGMEASLVPEHGFEVALLPGRGIQRRLTLDNVPAIGGLGIALVQAAALLARWRPRAVVTVGGYAGVATSLAAVVLRIPLVVINVDAVPGAANRLVGRWAAACAVALPGTPLPHAVVTGAPVRPEVLAAGRAPENRAKARAALGLPADAPVVAVTGGSLGAGRLNDAALGLAAELVAIGAGAGSDAGVASGDLAAGYPATDGRATDGRATQGAARGVIYHVTGRRDYERVRVAASAAGIGDAYRVVPYEEQMPLLLSACDLLVARAGASTVAEATVVGVPSVLVPLPDAPRDHQRRNAEVLAAAGAAVLLADADCTPERLASIVRALFSDHGRLELMAQAAARLGRPDAAQRVAELVERVAGGRVAEPAPWLAADARAGRGASGADR